MVSMQKLTLERLVLGFWVLGGGYVAGCTVGTNGTSPVADAMVDSSMDGVVEEAAVDASTDVTVPKDVAVPPEAANDGPDETSVPDAKSDAPTCTAMNCGGACCGSRCVARSCAGCEVGALFCPYSSTVPNSNGQCLASCSSCQVDGTATNIACFSCGSGSPIGTCQTTVAACPADTDGGACLCSPDAGNAGDAGTCPNSTQVCKGHACLTCGQSGTQGQQCVGGQSCNQTNAACGP
jgi:hypothetical protein